MTPVDPPGSAPDAALLDVGGLSPAHLAAWDALADRALEPNPFARPGFVLAVTQTRPADVVLAVVREGERWIACLPVRRERRWGRLPLPCLAPWMPDRAYLAAPLIDSARAQPALAALLELLATDRHAAMLVLDPIDPDGPLARAMTPALQACGLSPIVQSSFDRAALRRRPEPTYLQDAVSGSGRKKLRSRSRALARELGGDLRVVDRSGEAPAHEAFLALENTGWKNEQGTAMAGSPADADFFRRMCGAMAAAGRLQLLALEAGGRTAAMQCNLVDGDVLFAFKVAFDPELARFSPGATLEVEAMDVFHRLTAVNLADSCAAPDSALVNRLWPDRRRLQTLLVPTRERPGRLVRPAVRVEAAARAAAHRLRQAKLARQAR